MKSKSIYVHVLLCKFTDADSEAIRVIIRLGGGGDPGIQVPTAQAGRQPIRAQADPLVPGARPTASHRPIRARNRDDSGKCPAPSARTLRGLPVANRSSSRFRTLARAPAWPIG